MIPKITKGVQNVFKRVFQGAYKEAFKRIFNGVYMVVFKGVSKGVPRWSLHVTRRPP